MLFSKVVGLDEYDTCRNDFDDGFGLVYPKEH